MHVITNRRQAQLAIQIAMAAGATMLNNGAEIYRVEDTIERMLGSCQNLNEVEAIATYSSLIISFIYDEEVITRVNKIKSITTDLSKISDVNDFSRKFVVTDKDLRTCLEEINRISEKEAIGTLAGITAYSLSSAAFTVIVGGGILDFSLAFIIVFIAQGISTLTANQGRKYFMDTLLSSVIVASLALLFYELGMNINYNTVITGSIYQLFPGISLTNSARDFMNRDLLAGTLGLIQAVFVAGALALGVSLMIYIHSQVI